MQRFGLKGGQRMSRTRPLAALAAAPTGQCLCRVDDLPRQPQGSTVRVQRTVGGKEVGLPPGCGLLISRDAACGVVRPPSRKGTYRELSRRRRGTARHEMEHLLRCES